MADFAVDKDGSGTMSVRSSKTDQSGFGREAWLSVFAVKAVRRWLTAAKVTDGEIFRPISNDKRIGDQGIGPKEVNRIFKRVLRRLGVPEDEIRGIGGHSTRIGGAPCVLSSLMCETNFSLLIRT